MSTRVLIITNASRQNSGSSREDSQSIEIALLIDVTHSKTHAEWARYDLNLLKQQPAPAFCCMYRWLFITWAPFICPVLHGFIATAATAAQPTHPTNWFWLMFFHDRSYTCTHAVICHVLELKRYVFCCLSGSLITTWTPFGVHFGFVGSHGELHQGYHNTFIVHPYVVS